MTSSLEAEAHPGHILPVHRGGKERTCIQESACCGNPRGAGLRRAIEDHNTKRELRLSDVGEPILPGVPELVQFMGETQEVRLRKHLDS